MPSKVTEDRSPSRGRRSAGGSAAARLDREDCGDETPGVQRLYTVAMMAAVLPAPAAAVRHWRRNGLLVPVRRRGALEWFDFEQLVVGRRLARLLAGGLSLREIDAKLAGLARGGAAEAARVGERIVADGRRLSIDRGGRLLGAGGQLQFDFYSAGLVAGSGTGLEGPGHGEPHVDDRAAVLDLDAARPPRGVAIAIDGDGRPVEGQPSRPAAAAAGGDGRRGGNEDAVAELLDLAADLEAAGELVDAAEALRAVLQVQGPSATVAFMLAELLYRAGDLTGARERYYSVIEIDEDHLEARSNLACVLAELGEHELALAALEGVLRQQPDYADAHWHMAGVLGEIGRNADARRHLRAFLRLAPESPWAEIARERLAVPVTAPPATRDAVTKGPVPR